jgi:hypothetical protein
VDEIEEVKEDDQVADDECAEDEALADAEWVVDEEDGLADCDVTGPPPPVDLRLTEYEQSSLEAPFGEMIRLTFCPLKTVPVSLPVGWSLSTLTSVRSPVLVFSYVTDRVTGFFLETRSTVNSIVSLSFAAV